MWPQSVGRAGRGAQEMWEPWVWGSQGEGWLSSGFPATCRWGGVRLTPGASDKAEHLSALSNRIYFTDGHVLIIFHSSKQRTCESYVTFRKINSVLKRYEKIFTVRTIFSNCNEL